MKEKKKMGLGLKILLGMVLGIDRLFDMGRTSLNVIGDASCAVCVNHWEGRTAEKAAK